jgi:hypothetical protein
LNISLGRGPCSSFSAINKLYTILGVSVHLSPPALHTHHHRTAHTKMQLARGRLTSSTSARLGAGCTALQPHGVARILLPSHRSTACRAVEEQQQQQQQDAAESHKGARSWSAVQLAIQQVPCSAMALFEVLALHQLAPAPWHAGSGALRTAHQQQLSCGDNLVLWVRPTIYSCIVSFELIQIDSNPLMQTAQWTWTSSSAS